MSTAAIIFRITPHHGIWRVMRDGAFFGDYRSHSDAVEGAGEAVRVLSAAGCKAQLGPDNPATP